MSIDFELHRLILFKLVLITLQILPLCLRPKRMSFLTIPRSLYSCVEVEVFIVCMEISF